MILIATFTALLILTALTIFQFLLAIGTPLGKFAWGGSYKILPKKLRIASTLSIIIYAIIAVFIVSRADLLNLVRDEFILRISMWVLFVYFLSGVVLNAISRSKYERITMTPICVLLCGCLLILATNS